MADVVPTRRLVAILAADVVGFSRLMGADEVGTLAALKSRRRDVLNPLVARHQGRIFKTTGDGVLVAFDSAVGAVECAVALQAAMPAANAARPDGAQIVLRVAVNLGDVIVEGSDLYGDGINVAARLEAIAEPGGILLSGPAYDQVKNKIRLGFEDLGTRVLKNIAEPVRVYRIVDAAHAPRPAPATLVPATAVPATAPEVAPEHTPDRTPDKLTIAVLPFANMSGDPEQEYFADGLAEDLITDLARVPGFLVIARNSSFAYKGRAVDIRAVARELGVRHVVEGSVRRAAARIRVNAQLIDAETGSHLWAERYDRDLADVFTVQDEVVGHILNALTGTLTGTPTGQPTGTPTGTPAGISSAAPASAPRRTRSLEAYDLFLRGRWLAGESPEANRQARPLLARAIALDPGFAEAHAWFAWSYYYGWIHYGEPDETRGLARAAAEQAVALDAGNADAHIVLGYIRAYEGDLAGGVAEIELALRINPNHAWGWTLLADLRVHQGHALDSLACSEALLRIEPHLKGVYYWQIGWARYALRDYAAAVEALQHPEASGAGVKRLLAAALAQLGRTAEAAEQARLFLADHPRFSATQWGRAQPFADDADRRHFVAGYRKAGLPE
jgi:TolB-like protein/class 3 adenylate cyclase